MSTSRDKLIDLYTQVEEVVRKMDPTHTGLPDEISDPYGMILKSSLEYIEMAKSCTDRNQALNILKSIQFDLEKVFHVEKAMATSFQASGGPSLGGLFAATTVNDPARKAPTFQESDAVKAPPMSGQFAANAQGKTNLNGAGFTPDNGGGLPSTPNTGAESHLMAKSEDEAVEKAADATWVEDNSWGERDIAAQAIGGHPTDVIRKGIAAEAARPVATPDKTVVANSHPATKERNRTAQAAAARDTRIAKARTETSSTPRARR
jgi:hypothetical protein